MRGPRQVGRLVGERTSSEMSETCRLQRGEGYGACEDAAVRVRRIERREETTFNVKKERKDVFTISFWGNSISNSNNAF